MDEPGKINGEWASEALRSEQDASLEPVRDKVERHRKHIEEYRAAQQADPEGLAVDGSGLVHGITDTPEEQLGHHRAPQSPLAKRVAEYTEPRFEHDSPHAPQTIEEAAAQLRAEREAEAHGAEVSEAGNMAVFGTGATRNRKENELRYDGFLSPLALQMFARYMHKNRMTADGTIREPDNWQKGMPDASYLDSLLRHVMDIWLIYRGYPEAAREGKFESLSGAFFNIQGLMHNWMTEDVSLEEVLATLAATGTLEVPDGDA